MTKNAQQALKYLLQSSCYNVRFCLICNYISKIDDSLKNEFICIRFNQLPQNDIFKFIKNIAKNENLELSDAVIHRIQQIYNSDIRSIINYIQLNQTNISCENNIITDAVWEDMHQKIMSNTFTNKMQNDISIKYNIDKKNIIKSYFNFIIKKKPEIITDKFLTIVEVIMHSNDANVKHIMDYFILHIRYAAIACS